ncbi:MAG: FKBP-type peptidyl-prolyl cis-trans isomerase [Acidobacteriaceae bacterium]|jgi:peptidylprolyl isomerase
MKLIAVFLLAPTLAISQTAAKPKPTAAKPHAAAAVSSPGCVTEPQLSPKIPTLPAGSPCAKHLFTIVAAPSVKLENVSPLEGPGLAERLGIELSTFSLDYIDYKTGTGDLAAPALYYTVNYTGYLPDGSVFDSSTIQGAPHVFLYGQHQVIPGWDTGLNGMHVGGKRRLFIPWQLAYGTAGRPPKIPPKTALIFDVELLSQSDKAPPPPPKAAARPPLPSPLPPQSGPGQPTQGGPAVGLGNGATPTPATAPTPPPATPSPATPPKPQ